MTPPLRFGRSLGRDLRLPERGDAACFVEGRWQVQNSTPPFGLSNALLNPRFAVRAIAASLLPEFSGAPFAIDVFGRGKRSDLP